ncbi:TFIIH/NER complex subunit [Borealophlyctis nickersoniae]|nr:TFIIH/NER complex subunit [Borealophlyctis nickersoniae]
MPTTTTTTTRADSTSTIADLDNATCPICKADKYLNANMKLLVSPCYHKMCENCINRLFLQGPAPCPECKHILRKRDFVTQTFEDLQVEKEVQIRKRLARIYNKRLEDFKGVLRDYNDYLEEVEIHIFNLTYGIDVEATEEKLRKYEQENKQIIARNTAKQVQEAKLIANRLEIEKKDKIHRKEAYENQALEEAKAKQLENEEILKKLMSSGSTERAEDIIKQARTKRPQTSVLNFTSSSTVEPVAMEVDQEVPDRSAFDPMDYLYEEKQFTTVLDQYYDPWAEPKSEQQLIIARASGYTPKFTYSRAVSAAFGGLFAGMS